METIPITDLRLLGYQGSDASLEESLFEYGLAWIKGDAPDTYHIIYGVGNDPETDEYDTFCNASMSKEEFQEFFEVERLWKNMETFTGEKISTIIEMFPYSLLSFIQYYGTLNVFGDPSRLFKIGK